MRSHAQKAKEIAPPPEIPQRMADEWTERVRSFRALSRPGQQAWWNTLDESQREAFNRAWDRMGGNVPLASGVTCPNCQAIAKRGDYPVAVWIFCVLLFPIGLLALLTGRKPTICGNCGNTWQA